jgi:hypothetical protein
MSMSRCHNASPRSLTLAKGRNANAQKAGLVIADAKQLPDSGDLMNDLTDGYDTVLRICKCLTACVVALFPAGECCAGCRLHYSPANYFNNLSLDFARGLQSKRLR